MSGLSEQLFLGRAPCFALSAAEASKVGDIWQFDFESNRPVSPQEFFTLVQLFTEYNPEIEIIRFDAIDQTHFRATARMLESGIMPYTGGFGPFRESNVQYRYTAGPVWEKKRLSTGAIVGLSLVGMATVGGIAYAVVRRKGRRRR
jgi:hypothetical protein